MFLVLAGILVATLVAPAGRLDTVARLHALGTAALNVLVSLDGLVALDGLVGLNRLVVLDMGGVARLESLNVFVGLDSLHTLNALRALRALTELRAGLRSVQGLDALHISRADIAELFLEVRVLELRVAVRRIELPRLKTPGAGRDGDPVKSAVEGGIGLDRGVAGMPPIVAVP